MPHIELLDQITIDKIAAGEVIERPASVVKELVENAIDAGATAVTVEIEEGGIALIRIADNGCGIAKEDVANAFLRHSTSKIRSAEDLMSIGTLGFRGEALSSIAAVSQVELITKTKEETYGIKYTIEGGKEKGLDIVGATDGTTFLVRQLFYNTPARRKFLKTPMTEASHIQDLLIRLAMSHPEISFKFINNRQTKLHTSGNGKLKDVIYHIYGRDVANNLIEINYAKNQMSISGYLGKPMISRGNRNFENYYINHRYVKSNIISKAIEDGYKDYTMQHRYPFVALHIGLDQEKIDINVHPTKMELRFSNQQEVYNLLYEVVKMGLAEKELIPEIELPEPKVPEAKVEEEQPIRKTFSYTNEKRNTAAIPAKEQKEYQVPENKKQEMQEEKNLDYFMKKMRERVSSYHKQESQAEVTDKNQVFSKAMDRKLVEKAVQNRKNEEKEEKKTEHTPIKTEHTPFLKREKEEKTERALENKQINLFDEKIVEKDLRNEYKLIGQIFDTYWLVQFQDSLYIIDQHAAHERVLYEKTLAGMKKREYTSQLISPPIILSLSMQESELLNQFMDRFTSIGFEIEPFGGDEYAVRAVPDNLFGIAKKELLMEMIDMLSDGLSTEKAPELIDEKIASMSCKAAVKGNNKLSYQEMDSLIGELLKLENPYHCPHGRPTIIAMTKRELEKKFKRIV